MLNHIDYIYAIYKECSFTKAAEKLYVSQPALSLAITKLEKKLGYPLFERKGKGCVPTEYGEKCIEAIEKILCIKGDLENEIEEMMELKRGKIRIGTTSFISMYVLPDILQKFREAYPSVVIELFVEQSTVLEKRIQMDEVDIIIDNAVGENREMLYSPLFDERILIGIPKECEINRELTDALINISDLSASYGEAKKISIEKLKGEKFILLKEGNSMREIASGIFKEAEITPDVTFEFDQLMTSISYSECGFGLCFITDTIFKKHKTSLNLYVPNTSFSSRTVYLIRKKSRYVTGAVKAFSELTREHFKA